MNKFKVAFKGIKDAFKHKAVRIQFVLGILAIIGGLLIKLDYYEWLAFIICIVLVIGAEIFNTCIEKLCDLYSKENDERIRLIKDLSSGAVLVFSIGALIVCIFTVIRRILWVIKNY